MGVTWALLRSLLHKDILLGVSGNTLWDFQPFLPISVSSLKHVTKVPFSCFPRRLYAAT